MDMLGEMYKHFAEQLSNKVLAFFIFNQNLHQTAMGQAGMHLV
jgi:hypothetical protein